MFEARERMTSTGSWCACARRDLVVCSRLTAGSGTRWPAALNSPCRTTVPLGGRRLGESLTSKKGGLRLLDLLSIMVSILHQAG